MILRLFNKCGAGAGALALLGAGFVAAPHPAFASDWGCQVVLCLATPGSPTKYAQCVPPITKLWRVLSSGGSFPSRTGTGMKSSKTKHGYNLTVTRSDGSVARFSLDKRYQSITPQ